MNKFTTEYLKIIAENNEIDFGEATINFDKAKSVLKQKISDMDPTIGTIYLKNPRILMCCHISAKPNEKVYDEEKKKYVTCETYEELLKVDFSKIEWPWFIDNQYNYLALSWKGIDAADAVDQPMLIGTGKKPGEYTIPSDTNNHFASLDQAIQYFTSVWKKTAEDVYTKSKAMWEAAKNKK